MTRIRADNLSSRRMEDHQRRNALHAQGLRHLFAIPFKIHGQPRHGGKVLPKLLQISIKRYEHNLEIFSGRVGVELLQPRREVAARAAPVRAEVERQQRGRLFVPAPRWRTVCRQTTLG